MVPAHLAAFGYPDAHIRSFAHWSILAARKPVTLGTLLLVCHDVATTLGAVSDAAWVEFPTVLRDTEAALGARFAPDRMNLLFLMMANPQVHAALLPRYSGPREFEGARFTDVGWPSKPNLDVVHEFSDAAFAAHVAELRRAFDAVHAPTTSV